METRQVRLAQPMPRRMPRGRTGQAIVDSILNAAAAILAEGGYATLTTNRIAERAGVSIGSFYQYFPNKQAVISGLAADLERRALELFQERMAVVANESLEAVTRAVIEFMATERLGAQRMRHELLVHVPRAWTEQAAHAVDAQVEAALAAFLGSRPDVRAGNAELMAFVLLHAVEAAVEAAVLRRRELIGNSTLIDELTQLVLRYVS
jgi:AcrR family transcriptional regulator